MRSVAFALAVVSSAVIFGNATSAPAAPRAAIALNAGFFSDVESIVATAAPAIAEVSPAAGKLVNFAQEHEGAIAKGLKFAESAERLAKEHEGKAATDAPNKAKHMEMVSKLRALAKAERETAELRKAAVACLREHGQKLTAQAAVHKAALEAVQHLF